MKTRMKALAMMIMMPMMMIRDQAMVKVVMKLKKVEKSDIKIKTVICITKGSWINSTDNYSTIIPVVVEIGEEDDYKHGVCY